MSDIHVQVVKTQFRKALTFVFNKEVIKMMKKKGSFSALNVGWTNDENTVS